MKIGKTVVLTSAEFGFNEWYKPPGPAEIMRLTALKAEKLKKKGRSDEEINIIMREYLEDLSEREENAVI